MGIALSILGMFGKILLWILGILCVIVLLFLFYPIKYQMEISCQKADKIRGKVKWLLFFVRIYFSYEKEFRWKIYFFGVDLLKVKKNSDRKKQQKAFRKEKVKERGKGAADQWQAKKDVEEIRGIHQGKEENFVEGIAKETQAQERSFLQEGNMPLQKRKGFFSKIVQGIRHWWRKLCHLVSEIKNIIKNLRHKTGFAREIFSLLREENSKAFICILKDNVIHLWRKLKPKVLRGRLLFGTGDPASTGEILGVFAVLYPWYGDHIHITPDFERKIWEGEVFMKGGISLITIVVVLARVFLCDEWGRFKKGYKKIRTGI